MFCRHLFVVLALFLATFVAAADLYNTLNGASHLPFALEKRSVTHVCHCKFKSQLQVEILELRTRDSAEYIIQTGIMKAEMLK